ncbi:MAG: phosphoribosylaminoimidazolesuccinocarboxamide synthase [Planctomycetota bacterium]
MTEAGTPADALGTTTLGLPGRRRGKVRETYELSGPAGEPRLLIVASDRISAFDVVMPTLVPGKGRLLTEIAAFWLRFIEDRGICRTHLISTDASGIPDSAFDVAGATPRESLAGRVTIGRACRVIPVEFVVRGYLEGSGWREYERDGSVCGVSLPAGLARCSKLPEPIFTPATKAEDGEHDENIDFEAARRVCDAMAGAGVMTRLRDVSVAIYESAAAYALERGIILADTKFEFGLPIGANGEPTGEDAILIDEALTPDSSRFWPADGYAPGQRQPSFDKQYVREYLETLTASGAWDGQDPGPELPGEVVAGTLARYREARDRLTLPN